MSGEADSLHKALLRRIQSGHTRDLPARALAQLREAARLADRGDRASAERAALVALALAPSQPEVLWIGGVLRHRAGFAADGADLLARAVEQRPDDADLLAAHARALADAGDVAAAIGQQRRVCALRADNAVAWFDLAVLLDRHAEIDEALAAADRAIALDPRHELVRFERMRCLQMLGRIDEVAAECRRLIAMTRGVLRARAWFALLDLKTVRPTDDERESLRKLTTQTRAVGEERLLLDYTLGRACEMAGEYDAALAAFDRANAQRRLDQPWDAAAFSRRIEAIATAFAAAPDPTDSRRGHEVIFIVSLPRSGSTLIEQMLAAHPDVSGASELEELEGVLRAESNRRGRAFPDWVADATEADWARLGDEYLARTARWRGGHARFTDKMPENWPYLGAALRMLPGAHVVDCRRDPLETCWSCYKQLFAPGRVAYSYRLDDLAAYWKDYVRLCAQWARLYPDAVHVQSYEALVADPETAIRRLLDHLDLPFSDTCLRFHEVARGVRTTSSAQVREPMRRDTARAAKYGDLLLPLISALG